LGKEVKMRSVLMIVMAIGSIFIIQVVDLAAALLPKQVVIMIDSVRHGPKFGDGWSEEQKEVWNKTQEWWQTRIDSDWVKLKSLYHNVK
jgi:hypothetical protein